MHTTGLAPTIKENPPLIYHWRELGHEEHMEIFKNAFARYRETLAEHRRMLLDHFQLMDTAIKVVGVGSVGTWCAVILPAYVRCPAASGRDCAKTRNSVDDLI